MWQSARSLAQERFAVTLPCAEQKLQSRRGPGPGFLEMDDVMCEQIQRLGLLYPDDNARICFVLGMKEKGGCKAWKGVEWLIRVHQTRWLYSFRPSWESHNFQPNPRQRLTWYSRPCYHLLQSKLSIKVKGNSARP